MNSHAHINIIVLQYLNEYSCHLGMSSLQQEYLSPHVRQQLGSPCDPPQHESHMPGYCHAHPNVCNLHKIIYRRIVRAFLKTILCLFFILMMTHSVMTEARVIRIINRVTVIITAA